MFKNANIRSKKEAAQRLIDGEVFYYGDYKLFFKGVYDINTPFRQDVCYMDGDTWRNYAKWQIRIKWQENIGDGVLCWVSDTDNPPLKQTVELINSYNSVDKFIGSLTYWKYATPLTNEELKKYSFDRKPESGWSTGAATGFEEKPGTRRSDGTSVP